MKRKLFFQCAALAVLAGSIVILSLLAVRVVGQVQDQAESCAGGICRLIP